MAEATFPAIVLKSGDQPVAIPVQVTLAYDAEYDPFAVQMIVSAEGEPDAVWYFDRELLLRGANSFTPVGSGDVRFRYDGRQLLLCLRKVNGHADLGLPHVPVLAFLQETAAEIPVGEECTVERIDDLIEEILNG
jgi:hypothetical protein